MLHTLEVAQVARTIARGLRLNEDLCEAIALGHDLGHTPFGHTGERALDKVCSMGFRHNEQSVRIVEKLEHGGEGLNLTKEVRDGMLNHKSSCMPSTLEGKIVRYADKMAYINHDIEDAIRANIIKESDIPREYTDVLGNGATGRYTTLIMDIVSNSAGKNDVVMSDEIEKSFRGLREYMFEHVYTNEIAKGQEKKAENMVIELFEHYMKHFDELPKVYKDIMDKYGETRERVVCDYISGMTDRYAITKIQDLMIPASWGF
jgi:dGTPase